MGQIKVRTGVRAGNEGPLERIGSNHRQAAPIRLRSGVRAGGIKMQHSQPAIRVRTGVRCGPNVMGNELARWRKPSDQ